MSDDPYFLIGGDQYAIPTRESLTLDEHVVFFEWTGVDLETIDDTPVNSRMIGAFMQMAYQRANPDVPSQIARRLIGKSNFEQAVAAFAAAETEADDVGPPELSSTPPGPPGSPGNSGSSQPISGTGSTTRSDTPVNTQPNGGTPPSDTSATFDQLTSAA